MNTNVNIQADTGFTKIDSLGHPVDMTLFPYTRYHRTVTVRTDAGEESVSAVNWFETGKRGEAWEGKWITFYESFWSRAYMNIRMKQKFF